MRRRSFRTVPLRCSTRCRHCSRRYWMPVRRPRAAELSRGRRAHPRWGGVPSTLVPPSHLGPLTRPVGEGMAMTRLSPRRILAAGALTLTLALGSGLASGAEKLGSYPVDPGKVSISGISSGAFMANQFHIAHSALIMGAAMVAGGLYACAVDGVEGDRLRALDALATGPCMSQPDGLESVGTYQARVEEFARRGWIDPVRGLQGDRVYLFTGLADKVVNP